MAFFELSRSHFGAARRGLEEALSIELPLGDDLRIGNLRNDLGILENYEGRYAEAAASYALGLELRTAAGNAWGIASSLGNLGEAYHRLGDLPRAHEFLGKSLAAFHELGDMRSVAESLEMSTSLEVSAGRFERAARLAGSAASLREQMDFPKPAVEWHLFEDDLSSGLAALGPERWDSLVEEGRAAPLEAAVAWALERTEGQPTGLTIIGTEGLNPPERPIIAPATEARTPDESASAHAAAHGPLTPRRDLPALRFPPG